jgi:hypothetical protein
VGPTHAAGFVSKQQAASLVPRRAQFSAFKGRASILFNIKKCTLTERQTSNKPKIRVCEIIDVPIWNSYETEK